ncbi:alkaline phosphatase-like protein [Ramicandelaber brevisporus]|nr:alkaline phosphatase-like protein [Ramicandelaber brevisporus]
MKASTIFLAATAALGVSVANAASFLGIEHVVIFGVDGLGLEPLNALLSKNAVPSLIRIRQHGTVTHKSLSVQPTVSLPNWMTIMSSGDPVVTSMDSNSWTPKKSNSVQPLDGTCTYYPTLYSVLNKYEPDAVTGAWYYWDTLKYVFRPAKYTKINKKVATDEAAVNAFLADIKTVQPRASFVYLGDIDEVGHASGYGTAYDNQVKKTDGLIGEMLDAMKSVGMDYEKNTLIVVVTDHGRNIASGGRNHGSFTGPELNSQLVFAGPSSVIPQNKVLDIGFPKAVVSTTILAALGHNAPSQWTGRVAYEFFTDSAVSTIRAEQQSTSKPAAFGWRYVDPEGVDKTCMSL